MEAHGEYNMCKNEDTFSVSGMWYQYDKKRYSQMTPLKFINT